MTRLAASRLADLENVRSDLVAASATVSRRNSTVARLRAENLQLRGEISRLTSEVSSSQVLRDELRSSRQQLAGRDDKIERLQAVLASIRDLLDRGLAGPDRRPKFSSPR